MRGRTFDVPTEWLEFDDPSDEDQAWKVHIGFMMSSWQCLFGNGCKGLNGTEEHTPVEVGCCGHGAYINGKKERDMIQSRVDQLTEDDLGPKALADIRKNGWIRVFSEDDKTGLYNEDYLNAKTRVKNGGCVFANRMGDGGRIGCAFVLQAARLQDKPISEVDHTEAMPTVCWQLPIGIEHLTNDLGFTISTLVPWDATYWKGSTDEDGNTDTWLSWWCVDAPEAYVDQSRRLYRTMEMELRKTMGDASYELLRDELDKRGENYYQQMPAQIDARKMLPLTVVKH